MAAKLKLTAMLDLDSNVHCETEYRRSASPQANKTGADWEWRIPGFPVSWAARRRVCREERREQAPALQGRGNEKIFRYDVQEDRTNPKQHLNL